MMNKAFKYVLVGLILMVVQTTSIYYVEIAFWFLFWKKNIAWKIEICLKYLNSNSDHD
jgi:hypothetical protein